MNTDAETRRAADLVEEGIAALISGRKAEARLLLGQALEVDPHSEKGWLWLSGAVDTDEERRFCLRQVLSINERNPAAQKGLRELGAGFARSPLAPSAAVARPQPSATAARPEPPTTAATTGPSTAEPPAWSQWRQEADLPEATQEPLSTQEPLPRTWLVVAAILAAGLIVGLALLFVVNMGLLGK